MRDVLIVVEKAPPPQKIPHESDALMQLHVVVVPLFLVAYSNKGGYTLLIHKINEK